MMPIQFYINSSPWIKFLTFRSLQWPAQYAQWCHFPHTLSNMNSGLDQALLIHECDACGLDEQVVGRTCSGLETIDAI